MNPGGFNSRVRCKGDCTYQKPHSAEVLDGDMGWGRHFRVLYCVKLSWISSDVGRWGAENVGKIDKKDGGRNLEKRIWNFIMQDSAQLSA
jgi:hypothetical protein